MKHRLGILFMGIVLVLGVTLSAAIAARGAGHEGPAAAKDEAPPAHAEGKGEAGETKKGEGGEKGAEKGGEKGTEKANAPKPVQYQLGAPLRGHYDVTVFRSDPRIRKFRYPLSKLEHSFGPRASKLAVQCVLEFGNASGMAETGELEKALMEDIERVVNRHDIAALATVAGKMDLKNELIETLDRRFKTAQIRQIYFSEFQIIP